MGIEALEQAQAALSALSAVDPAALPHHATRAVIVGLRQAITGFEAELARHVHHADRAELWRVDGATSMEAWLAAATRSTIRSANAQVRLADVLAAAPAVADKMRAGEVSLDNAQLLGAVVGHEAFAADVELLLEIASTSSPRDTRKALEHWVATVDPVGERERHSDHASREYLRFTPTADGMHQVEGLLTGGSMAQVNVALAHIAGAAFADESGRSHPKRVADALTELCGAYSAGTVTGGRERPTLLVSVPFETVTERAEHRGTVIGTDITLSGDEARALACTAELHRLITAGRSVTLDFGAATRLATASQFLVLAERDGGCRWSGCDRPPQWCDVHHIDEFHRDDGPTDLINMVLLCTTHHLLVHDLRWQLEGTAHELRIRKPDGTFLDAPPRGRAALYQLELLSA